ncbi:MAG: histidine kinase, partial [Marinilabiliales bacterium]|nr:histidine kinase [Marinilabiliales bacterium]
MNLRNLFCSLLLLLICLEVSAQDPFIQHFSTSDGLPSNVVLKVFQDHRKFLWFSTDAGISSFDGSKFTNYRKQDGLSSNEVFDIKEDSFGRIWFLHTNAAIDFFFENKIFNERNTPFLHALRSEELFRKIYEDREGNLYFYQNIKLRIHLLDAKNKVSQFKLLNIPYQNNFRSYMGEAMSLRYLSKDSLGIFHMYSLAGGFQARNLMERPVLESDRYRIKEIFTASNQKKYALVRENDSTRYTIREFQGGHVLGEMKPFRTTGTDFVTSILEDNEQLLWIATYDRGVFCFKENQLIYHFDIKDAKSLIQDHEHNIWISSAKDGVYRISPYFGSHIHIDRSVFNNSGVFALCQRDTTGLWLTNGHLIYLLDKRVVYPLEFQKTERSLNQITQVKENLVFIGESGKFPFALNGLRFNRTAGKLTVDNVQRSPIAFTKFFSNPSTNEIGGFGQNFLFHLTPENLFKKMRILNVGTQIFNVYFNPSDELIVNASNNYLTENKTKTEVPELAPFSNKIISDHLNLDKFTELFNIEGDSLFLMRDKKIWNLSADFEQPIDLLIKHLAYHDSTLFIATSRNIYLCNLPRNSQSGKKITLVPLNLRFNAIHDLCCAHEHLYIASDDGLTLMPLKEVTAGNTNRPIPYFQSIRVNEKENLLNSRNINMMTSQRLNITFGSINYSTSPVIFSYKLEGADANWTEVRGNNVVLQNLAKGDYRFMLRARKPATEWSDPIECSIRVQATFWQHPLFYLFIVLLLAGMVFLFVIRRKNLELRKRQMENQILQFEQKAHQAMMNPHFIFNTLGSIQNYLLHNQPNEAGIYLSQFARLIRQNLNSIDSSVINLDEEVTRLKN